MCTEAACLHWARVSSTPSEGIWFCLSRAIWVPLIMFSRCVLRVFSLSLLSPSDLSPALSPFALLCRSESTHPCPRSCMATFWYADTQAQVRPTPGAPHGDDGPLSFTSRLSGQAAGPAGSQRRSRRASASQRWDSRVAWGGAFDVALSQAVLPRYYTFN